MPPNKQPSNSLRTSKNRFPVKSLHRFCFLVGAGISVPSGIPSGWSFNRTLAFFLGTSKSEVEDLLSSLTIEEGENNRSVRFEEVIEILRDTVDSQLVILRIFDDNERSDNSPFLSCGRGAKKSPRLDNEL